MKEKNYSKQILTILSNSIHPLTSRGIASRINKDEPFTRVYLNRLRSQKKIELFDEKLGKYNLYVISPKYHYEKLNLRLKKKLEQEIYLREQYENIVKTQNIKIQELKKEIELQKIRLVLI